MDDIIKLLKIARDETTTLVTYAEMLDGTVRALLVR